MRRISLLLTFFLTGTLAMNLAWAQETTATLSGLVSDSKQQPVPGASVIVKHEPTGYTTGTQTNNKGIFYIPNLRVGGPYTIKISYTGLKEETLDNVNLSLGNNPDVNVSLQAEDKSLKEVVIVGGRRVASSGLTVGREQLRTLPTLGRSLSDYTRLTPQSNNNSFAGTNFRYNNITLDGAMNNDAIGFSNSFGGVSGGGQSGTAGSGTRTNPYSLDVIQEVQVQLAPYDVKLGNFTGGTVNAVTKSGGNDFHGSVYGYGRNKILVGKGPDDKKSIGSDFYDYQFGGTLSGPIIKNKLFFIANVEFTRRQEPTFYNVGDVGAAMTQTQADQITAAFKAAGFDPGSYAPGKIFTNSDKYFGRLDYNISPKTTLTLRGIYTKGWGNNLERTPAVYQFSSTDFTQYSKNINIVAELKTKFSNTVNNQLILGYINVHDYRTFPGAFDNVTPYVDITNGASNIWLGTWREAAIYDQRQKTFEFTDNVTWNKGIHKFTFGTHNEFYSFDYGFVNSWNGRWQYGNVANFVGNMPSRIRAAYQPGEGKNNYDELRTNTPGSEFSVGLLSAYVQDEISITKRFKITPGVRIDYSYVGDQPATDTALNNTANYVNPTNPTYSHTPFGQFDNKWFGNVAFSPRLGFNWDIKGDKSVVLRGGTGIFTGRIPFAWLGYAYTLSGPNFNNIDYKPASGTVVPLVGPSNLVSTIGGVSPGSIKTRELDLVDNKFKLPTIWRSSIAVDYKFGHGYKATVEGMYTKTIHDVLFQQINKKDVTQFFPTGPTQTPVYTGGNLNSQFANVFLLSNTGKGYRYNITGQISKVSDPIRNGHGGAFTYNWSVAYTYGMSKDVANGIRNSMQSNWDYNPAISSNNPQLGYSNFDLRHRIVATLGGSMSWNAVHTTSLNFFYSGQSGSPYTVIYAGVPGNILNPNSALPYIPTVTESQTMLPDAANRAAFNAFVDADSYLKTRRGKYAERNGMRTPWNHELDLKLMHEFHLSSSNKQHVLAISLDIFNVLNLINNNWGHITFVSNLNNYTVNFLKFVNDAGGNAPGNPYKADGTTVNYTPTFQFQQPTIGNHYYYNDPINSRWQGQLGLKYTF